MTHCANHKRTQDSQQLSQVLYSHISLVEVALDNELVLLRVTATDHEVVLARNKPVEALKPRGLAHDRSGRGLCAHLQACVFARSQQFACLQGYNQEQSLHLQEQACPTPKETGRVGGNETISAKGGNRNQRLNSPSTNSTGVYSNSSSKLRLLNSSGYTSSHEWLWLGFKPFERKNNSFLVASSLS